MRTSGVVNRPMLKLRRRPDSIMATRSHSRDRRHGVTASRSAAQYQLETRCFLRRALVVHLFGADRGHPHPTLLVRVDGKQRRRFLGRRTSVINRHRMTEYRDCGTGSGSELEGG